MTPCIFLLFLTFYRPDVISRSAVAIPTGFIVFRRVFKEAFNFRFGFARSRGVARDSPTQAGTRRNTDGAAEGDVGGEKVAVRLVGIGGLSLLLPESAGRKLIPRDAPLETATFHLKDVSRGGNRL